MQMISWKNRTAIVMTSLVVLVSLVVSQSSSGAPRVSAKTTAKGMVVSEDDWASRAGAKVLSEGGNAVDAAVATALVLAVVRPNSGSLGGGGFFVHCPVKDACDVVDYREVAPMESTQADYMRDGVFDPDLSQVGVRAIGIPGVIAGLHQVLSRHGTRKWATLFQEPIRLAEHGFRVEGDLASAIQDRWEDFNPEAKSLYSCGRQGPCKIGDLLKQPGLAQFLKLLKVNGPKAFYEGAWAKKLVDEIRNSGGKWSLDDLRNYQPKKREPLTGRVKGFEIITMPPPSAGGALLLQMMKYSELAESSDAFKNGFHSVSTLHALATAMTLSFSDRARWFGDPDFTKIPLSQLLNDSVIQNRWKAHYDAKKVIAVSGPTVVEPDTSHTTHLSVMDSKGRAVAITTTLNGDFGSAYAPKDLGFVLNNELDDFSIVPNTGNLFGLVGGEANAIVGGKKPLSSMTPTIVRDAQGVNRIVIGAAGGPRITSSVFVTLLKRIFFKESLSDAAHGLRVHHQWKPNELRVEEGQIGFETRKGLEALGHVIKPVSALATLQALERLDDGTVVGVADPRGEGTGQGD